MERRKNKTSQPFQPAIQVGKTASWCARVSEAGASPTRARIEDRLTAVGLAWLLQQATCEQLEFCIE